MQVWKRIINTNYTSGRQGRNINYLVFHTEGVTSKIDNWVDRTLYWWFNNPAAQVSAHYYVTFSGTIEQYVEDWDTAWHAGIWDPYNLESIGVETQDNGYYRQPVRYTDAQYEGWAQLLAEVKRKYGMHIVGIRHNQLVQRECPGDLDVDRINRRAAEILAPPPPPPDELYRVFKDNNQIGAFKERDNAFNLWYSNQVGGKVTYKNNVITSDFVNEMKILEEQVNQYKSLLLSKEEDLKTLQGQLNQKDVDLGLKEAEIKRLRTDSIDRKNFDIGEVLGLIVLKILSKLR